MTDVTFRQKQEPSEPASMEIKGDGKITATAVTDAPLLDYHLETGKPFSVDYFELGKYWDTGDAYTEEINTIQDFFKHMVEQGKMDNSTAAAREKLKQIDRLVGKQDRVAVRVGKVAAYVKFLMESEKIDHTSTKYMIYK